MTVKTLTRADLPDSDKWDLSHLFTNADKWTEDFAWLQRAYPKIADWKGLDDLANKSQILAACTKIMEGDRKGDTPRGNNRDLFGGSQSLA